MRLRHADHAASVLFPAEGGRIPIVAPVVRDGGFLRRQRVQWNADVDGAVAGKIADYDRARVAIK